MAENLTPQQRMAVYDRGGNLLVSAAAGSGKTKVLVDRVMRYVSDPTDPANIDDFLIITYTKAAAAELRGKIANKLSQLIAVTPENRHLQRQVQRLYLTKISTVHAFCADILRQYAYKLDISADFHVGDENACIQLRQAAMEEILEEAYSQLDTDADFRTFVDTQGLGRNDRFVPEIIEQVYDSARCHLDPQAWCDACVDHLGTKGFENPEETVWGRYLMDALFLTLDHQISAMEQCVNAVQALEGMEKPASLLLDIINQIRTLRESKTWDEVVLRKGIDFGRLTFPKKYDDPSVTEPVKAVRKACKEIIEEKTRVFADTAENVLADMQTTAAAARGLMKLVSAFSDRYTQKKKKRKILDFSDLEQLMLDLLLGKHRTGTTYVAAEVSDRFREIMVDEYQDSNKVQDAIFAALTDKKNNLFMVGDVKQSIYQFRLADPGIFLEKYASFQPAETALPGQNRKILLSHNFRSSSGIIHAVNDVFTECMSQEVGGLAYGEDEALHEGIPHVALGEPEVEFYGLSVREDTYAEEAAFVAERIRQLLDGTHYVRAGDSLRPIVPEDIVILLRSPGSVGLDFQDALQSLGIRCATSGGSDLLQTEEIGTLRSLLQVISNPRQDIPLIAVLASPVFGFTANELADLRAQDKKCSFFEALCRSDSQKAREIVLTLRNLRRRAAMHTVPELLELIFEHTGLDSVFAAMDDGRQRQENLHAFYQLAVDCSDGGMCGLDQFLSRLDTLSEKGLLSVAENTPSDCVTIMSIHKSKGLEFPVVFLCGLSRKFNQESLRAQVLCHKELGLGLSCIDRENRVRYPTISKSAIAAAMTSDGISEELRVLYVALTRPKDRLIMTYASGNLEKDVMDIAKRMEFSDRYTMTAEVSSPGQWILYSALTRTEAGQLHALGWKPSCSRVYHSPWLIRAVETGEPCEHQEQLDIPVQECTDISELDRAKQFLGVQYAYIPSTVTPSKQTATQKKGRVKDQEAHEYASEQKHIVKTWRYPSFADKKMDVTAYGNAMHAAMQYIHYEACDSVPAVKTELLRLVKEGFLSNEQTKLVDPVRIAAFFSTQVGKKLRHSNSVLREFKFSILEDAAEYGDGLTGEQILLQGVVDCALVEEDGITIIDFKTDFVTEESLEATIGRYTAQVVSYAQALSKIFKRPILGKALYFFRLNRFIWL